MIMKKNPIITCLFWLEKQLPLPAGGKQIKESSWKGLRCCLSIRNRGLGAIILKEVLKDVIPLEKTIYLHSQLRAVPFYERNGFIKEGPVFYEADMGHYFMKFKTS